MKRFTQIGISAILALMFLSGCGMKTTEYTLLADNVTVLRNYRGKVKISVKDFNAKNSGKTSVICRLGEPIKTPQGESFEKYIQNAFIQELKMAEVYDKNANIQISGYLEDIYASSALGNAYWEIKLKVSSSNGKSFEVATKREYASVFNGEQACRNMAAEFSPTVRRLINDIVTNKKFPSLLE